MRMTNVQYAYPIAIGLSTNYWILHADCKQHVKIIELAKQAFTYF